jgi:tellurium resistance protein TerD
MISLQKGGKIMLEKSNESGTALKNIKVGLGWDEKPSAVQGADFDLDAAIVTLDANGNSIPGGFLYYNSPKNAEGLLHIFDGALTHSGDNLTGAGDGDDETINIDLSRVPANVDKMIVVVNIHEANLRGHNFGMAENSYIRLLNADNGDEELIHFDLNFDASTATGAKFATIFRKNGEWAFSADQVEFAGGLEAIVNEYQLS